MRDMAALLRGGASPAAPDRVTVSEKDAAAERDPNASALGTRDSRVDSGAGGESSNAGFKTLTARKYVPAAAHEPPAAAAPRATSVRVRLGKDGRLADAEYAALRAAYLASAPARGGRSGKTDAGAAYERVPEAAVAMADARRGGAEAR